MSPKKGQNKQSDNGSMHSDSTHDSSHDNTFTEPLPDIGREASTTLYARAGDKKVTLQDFEIKKVIGRGSFGKVFLVCKKGS